MIISEERIHSIPGPEERVCVYRSVFCSILRVLPCFMWLRFQTPWLESMLKQDENHTHKKYKSSNRHSACRTWSLSMGSSTRQGYSEVCKDILVFMMRGGGKCWHEHSTVHGAVPPKRTYSDDMLMLTSPAGWHRSSHGWQ